MLERTRPFGLVADAFGCARRSPDPRRRAITGLLAAGGSGEHSPITVTSDPGLRFRAVDAFADLAEELALPGPLVIGVDDLQWADASSLLTLGAHDALGELERAADSPGLADAEPAAWAWAAYARLWLGDLDGAATVAEQARLAAGSADDHLSVSVAMTTLARILEFRGHLRDALHVIDEAVRLADLSPGRRGHRYPVCMTRGHILIELDRLDEARSVLGTGRRISEELGVRAQETASAAARDLAGWSPGYRTSWAAWPHALILEADGERGRALATLADTWDRCTSAGLALEYPAVGQDLVRLALTADDLARARDSSALVTELASGNDLPWMTGAVLRCQGLVQDDAEILKDAAVAYSRGARPLGLALACEDAGTTFAGRVTWIAVGRSLIRR